MEEDIQTIFTNCIVGHPMVKNKKGHNLNNNVFSRPPILIFRTGIKLKKFLCQELQPHSYL